MCCEAVDAEALWKHRPTKPMSGKFPYYFLWGFYFFLPVVMSIASPTETDGLLQQTQNDLVVWSEAHQGENFASQTMLDGMKFGLCTVGNKTLTMFCTFGKTSPLLKKKLS